MNLKLFSIMDMVDQRCVFLPVHQNGILFAVLTLPYMLLVPPIAVLPVSVIARLLSRGRTWYRTAR